MLAVLPLAAAAPFGYTFRITTAPDGTGKPIRRQESSQCNRQRLTQFTYRARPGRVQSRCLRLRVIDFGHIRQPERRIVCDTSRKRRP